MQYYPIMLALEGRRTLVVGGGKVAERKVEALLEYGARVSLVSKNLTGRLAQLKNEGRLEFLGDWFDPAQLEGAFLVIAATDDRALNHLVSQHAQKRGLLINAVDQPEDCTFILPSIVRRGDLVLAASTCGRSPATAKRIRQRLETLFGEEYAVFLELMGRVRERVLALHLPQPENSRIFHELAASGALEALSREDWDAVDSILKGVLPEGIDTREICRAVVRSGEAGE